MTQSGQFILKINIHSPITTDNAKSWAGGLAYLFL